MTFSAESIAGSPTLPRVTEATPPRAQIERLVTIAQERWAWLLALTGLMAVLMVYVVQVQQRTQTLVWDEAVRVRSARNLTNLLDHGEWQMSWDWIHAQVIYPFLYPGLQGVVMSLGVSPLTTAVGPSLVAFAIAGLLTARLTRELGGSRGAAFTAAGLYWLTPLCVRLAAWGSFEHIGACVFLSMALMLVKLEREQKLRYAIAAGCLAAIACFLKWDYSVVAAGSMGMSVVVTAVWIRKLKPVALNLAGAATFAGIMAAWLAVNWHDKREGLRDVIGTGSNYDLPNRNPLFYLEGIFSTPSGLSPLIAALMVAGLGYAAYCTLTRRWPAAVVVVPGVALVMYSASDVKHLRYIVPFLGLLAAFGTILLFDLLERIDRRAVPAGVTVVALAVGMQVFGSNGVSSQFAYLAPQQSAYDVLAYVDQKVHGERRPVILINSTNQINLYDIELRWWQHRDRMPPQTILLNVAPGNDGEKEFMRNAIHARGGLIFGFDFAPSSSLYSPDDVQIAELYPDYLRVAFDLEASGKLMRIDTLELEDGATKVHVWRLDPAVYAKPNQIRLQPVTTPE